MSELTKKQTEATLEQKANGYKKKNLKSGKNVNLTERNHKVLTEKLNK